MSDLFTKLKHKRLNYKTGDLPKSPTDLNTLPALTAGILNQGLNNYVPKVGATVFKNVISVSANGANTGAMFYQTHPFTVLQDAYVIDLIDKLKPSDMAYLYLLGALQKSIRFNFSWTNKAGWERIKGEKITLPVDKNGLLDFDYMEAYIKELEAERIKELEAYLAATGLNDYVLTDEEKKLLDDFNSNNIRVSNFRMIDILDWQPQKEINPRALDDLYDPKVSPQPFYGQATLNNGIISFEQLTNGVLNNKNEKPTILIHSNNQNVVYLETPFYLKDGHGATSVIQSESLNKLNALFIMSVVSKSVTNLFDYNNKATKIALKNMHIQLPTMDGGEPDYDFMVVYIRAIEKLVIKGVIEWINKQIEATRDVVNSD
nr:restriction endonuclease subunit S [Convivina intestini]